MKDNKDIVIGIDIGTGGVKAVLFYLKGYGIASSFRKSELRKSGNGTVVEEDPEFQLSNVCSAIAECMSKSRRSPSDVAAIGIDGQMAGIIGIGKDGRCVTPYDSWLDTRCTPFISKMDKTAGEEILLKSGCAPAVNHGPKILWWMKEKPEVFRKISSFVQPGGYAAMRLCGLNASKAFIDNTYLHFSGFADNAKSCWNMDLCRRFGLDVGLLPRIARPEEIIGELSSEMAGKCGLRAGVPVVAGCGDTAASFLSCGAVSEGICVDVAGTASVFAVTTGKFKPDKINGMLACGRAVTPGLWHSYAYINGGGMNLEWSRDIVAQNHKSLKGAGGFDRLERLVSEIKPDIGLPLFIPHLGGRVSPAQPDMRGAWLNLSWNHDCSHLFRAVLEGVALEYMIYSKAIMSLYPKISLEELRVTGGGEKSDAWNQIKADALKMPVRRIAQGHGAPLGAAIVAAWGAGLIAGPGKAVAKWIRLSGRFNPNPKLAGFYRKRLNQYEKALTFLKEKL
jgi:xylulokinase